MNYKTLWPNEKAPQIVNAIIEMAACSTPVKYEMDKDSNLLHVDRFLATSMHYPCNYGYVPGTLSDDGDPVDILVVTPFPLIAGCAIEVRPVGMLEMTDDKGQDRKVLSVPTSDLIDIYNHVKDFNDLPASLLKKIEHFFKFKKWFQNTEAGRAARLEFHRAIVDPVRRMINIRMPRIRSNRLRLGPSEEDEHMYPYLRTWHRALWDCDAFNIALPEVESSDEEDCVDPTVARAIARSNAQAMYSVDPYNDGRGVDFDVAFLLKCIARENEDDDHLLRLAEQFAQEEARRLEADRLRRQQELARLARMEARERELMRIEDELSRALRDARKRKEIMEKTQRLK